MGDKNLISYDVIEMAIAGHVESMDLIINNYAPYINALSKKQLKNHAGDLVAGIDEDLRFRLEAKLIAKTLTFRM